MSSQARSLFVIALILLGATQIEGKVVASTSSKASASGGGGGTTRAKSTVTAKVIGGGSATGVSKVEAVNGGKAVSDLTVIAKDGADVSGEAGAKAVGKGAVAIVKELVKGGYKSKAVGKAFAQAFADGDGPAIAKILLEAKAMGDEVSGEASQALGLAYATALNDGPKGFASVAKTTARAIAEKGESRVVIGESLSKLIVEKGCKAVQDFVQKTEAEASSKGNQRAFFEAANVDVAVIRCAFPDTCGTDGVDKRGECCGNKEATKTGKCGKCKDGKCDFWMVWQNPNFIWTCDRADCKNKKPCICG